ncbi:MAG: acyl-CoA thioesterase [Bacteroidetes bacterium]|nr:MAG: acyl-CoA thioesterase [Bacteroidota bacterium]
MLWHDTQLRVRYADTDQMGYVYYGKYAEYFEVGRVELIRHLGIPYTQIEAQGIMMPVAELHIAYKVPARYDELLRIRSCIPESPRGSLLTTYEVYKEQGELSATGEVRLAFIDMQRQRPVRVPDFILQAVSKHWPAGA